MADADVMGDDQEGQALLTLSRRTRATIFLGVLAVEVAPSAPTIAALLTSARAIVAGCRCPPESSSGRCSALDETDQVKRAKCPAPRLLRRNARCAADRITIPPLSRSRMSVGTEMPAENYATAFPCRQLPREIRPT
jgi:hypothetical protein